MRNLPRAKAFRAYAFSHLLLLLFPAVSVANEIYFYCSGVTQGKTIADSPHNFDLQVGINPPFLNGPQGPLGMCIAFDETQRKNIKWSCSINDVQLRCECSGGDYIINATHTLSRISGKLRFTSVLKNDVFYGEYDCKRVSKKVF